MDKKTQGHHGGESHISACSSRLRYIRVDSFRPNFSVYVTCCTGVYMPRDVFKSHRLICEVLAVSSYGSVRGIDVTYLKSKMTFQ